MWHALSVPLLAYVPGALIFRLPAGDRSRRAALSAEERVFWGILLSLALSCAIALGLAAAGWYRFDRLLWIDGAIALLILALARGRLRLGSTAPRPTWTVLPPIALVIAGSWLNFFVPPAEYIIGGKDPGVYMNEGIQIAQRGALVIKDEVAGSVPAPFRDLFFPPRGDGSYYSNRFMGFFLLDPGTGTVVGQFPHLYPVSIAIAYGVDGLSGARYVAGVWAVLGLLALYFAGARIMGRRAALAGAGLLAVHVLQIWNARYPNAEIVMQPLVFAGLLAYARALVDEDRFFAPVAALLIVLCVFTHVTGVLVVGAVGVAACLTFAGGGRVRLSLLAPLVVGTGLAVWYFAVYIPPYFSGPADFVGNLRPLDFALFALAMSVTIGLVAGARRVHATAHLRLASVGLAVAVWALAGYGYFIRSAGGPLAVHDADSLRTFTSFYLSQYGLAAALVGFALIAGSLPPDTAFLFTISLFSVLFFYKIRIVPEHFWAGRRFLAVILPGSLLLVGAAAFGNLRFAAASRFGRGHEDTKARTRMAGLLRVFESSWLHLERGPRTARYALGLALVLLLGWRFLGEARPILRHVEYAGLIPRLERLAGLFGDDDLVLVESRAASDIHVLALPLAYIYARHTLVFAASNPDKQAFREFLVWARKRYRRVFFVGGGGTELLSRGMTVKTIGGERFQIPEYESAWNAYPRRVRFKEFDLGVYEFLPAPAPADGFALDVGVADDLYVRHFHAKEQDASGFTFRWTWDVSYVSIVGTRPEHRLLTVWMGNGGRPASADAAQVEVFLNDNAIGSVTVGPGLEPYRFAIPAPLAEAVARSEDAAQLRIVTRTWDPARVLGTGDDRDLGVMVDRIAIR